MKREVKEEAGYEFNPKALIAVEFQSFNWIRFTFIGILNHDHLMLQYVSYHTHTYIYYMLTCIHTCIIYGHNFYF